MINSYRVQLQKLSSLVGLLNKMDTGLDGFQISRRVVMSKCKTVAHLLSSMQPYVDQSNQACHAKQHKKRKHTMKLLQPLLEYLCALGVKDGMSPHFILLCPYAEPRLRPNFPINFPTFSPLVEKMMRDEHNLACFLSKENQIGQNHLKT